MISGTAQSSTPSLRQQAGHQRVHVGSRNFPAAQLDISQRPHMAHTGLLWSYRRGVRTSSWLLCVYLVTSFWGFGQESHLCCPLVHVGTSGAESLAKWVDFLIQMQERKNFGGVKLGFRFRTWNFKFSRAFCSFASSDQQFLFNSLGQHSCWFFFEFASEWLLFILVKPSNHPLEKNWRLLSVLCL